MTYLIQRTTLLFTIIIFAVSCKKTMPIDNIKDLNGYWTIEKVVLANGSEKSYSMSMVVDYFEITGDSVGFRKKMNPKLDGSFEMNKDLENFSIKTRTEKHQAKKLQLRYKTDFDTWEETIVKLQDSVLLLENEAGNVYFYKRFRPFTFNE